MTIEEAIRAAVRAELDERLRPIEDQLRKLRPASEDDVLDVAGAAPLTGLTPRTLRAKASRGEIPAFKLPGSRGWRFRRRELLAWREPHPVDTENEARKIVGRLRGR